MIRTAGRAAPLSCKGTRDCSAKPLEGSPIIGSRDATAAEQPEPNDRDPGSIDHLIITFDRQLKNHENGIQLGPNPITSDILLGHRGTRTISAKQCNIVVDDDLSTWLHDYFSAYGTAVGHNNQNQKEVQKKDKWILA
jgi:hypothetical protein